ncbi:hypothetical protein Tco_0572658 [Tanacetum coccineum]
MGSAITYDSTRGTESGEERFKKFANNSGVVGGERFRFNPILTSSRRHEYVNYCSSLRLRNGPEIDAPHVKDFANLDGILRHFITLQNFSFLMLTSDTTGDQSLGILDKLYGQSTDIAKITRKRSKPGKLKHGNGKSAQEPKV